MRGSRCGHPRPPKIQSQLANNPILQLEDLPDRAIQLQGAGHLPGFDIQDARRDPHLIGDALVASRKHPLDAEPAAYFDLTGILLREWWTPPPSHIVGRGFGPHHRNCAGLLEIGDDGLGDASTNPGITGPPRDIREGQDRHACGRVGVLWRWALRLC